MVNSFAGEIPKEMGNLLNLEALIIENNSLSGLIPSSIFNITSLKQLVLARNSLTGVIPQEVCDLHNLEGFSLGNLPSSTGNRLPNLEVLHLADNNLSGILPDFISNASQLTFLDLSHNLFTGSIPNSLGNLTIKKIVAKLNSSIPTSFWSLTDLLELSLSSNSLSGGLPPDIGNLKAAYLIDLSMNQFSGDIPSTISSLKNLINLSLAHNIIQGPIPDSFGTLVNLEFLDLSQNILSGVIPKSLEALLYLKYFSVSFNGLRGEIPYGGAITKFTYQSFMSNEALCGVPQFQVQPCDNSSPHKSKTQRMFLTMLPRVGRVRLKNGGSDAYPVSVSVSCRVDTGTLAFTDESRWRRSKVSIQTELISIVKSGRIPYHELVRATDGFSESNLLGMGSFGSVYRYNYFLDISKRLDIMIDVVCALAYLHHDYSMCVVHCDLKPSNVLLDEDMVAHVRDFGIAKLLEQGESITVTKTLATFRYIVPEYGFEGFVSIRCDVYSYGIILMKTFTRRKPTDEILAGDMSLKSWVNQSLPNKIIQVIDSNLLRPKEAHFTAKLQCLSFIMEMAQNCLTKSPQERINIKDALVTLKKIKLQLLLKNCDGT
ncbi:probable LRR receptor-like serine/threonine-protein kinase At3g47570 [Cornus florida]|uniref:probable LRR receptor-like serine/threonine-protein kinase At3g47570 n=1 Tax=Cornus florida TaxID=4283 RepID=UPI0028A0CDCD|nr:probable LRR receptor-like serine/threonine-protein kinase At3g47570 [Cornus florida]